MQEMEPDSTSNLTNNINAPDTIDKYNTKLVSDLLKKIEKLEKEKAELTLEHVQYQVKKNIEYEVKKNIEEKDQNVEYVQQKSYLDTMRRRHGSACTITQLPHDNEFLAEETETLKRLVAVKENRVALLEEEKQVMAYQMEKSTSFLRQDVQMKEMALYEAQMQNQQLYKRECQAQVELSQCRMQLSNLQNQRSLVTKLISEKDQALMLVGVWQDKCKAQESRADRLEARLKVLCAVETDDETNDEL